MVRHDPRGPAAACLALGVSITAAADALGVTRKHISEIVNRRAPVSADMALRLASALGTEPELWVNMQAQYDLWEAEQKAPPKVRALHVA
jgi:antitoxin HigA-1